MPPVADFGSLLQINDSNNNTLLASAAQRVFCGVAGRDRLAVSPPKKVAGTLGGERSVANGIGGEFRRPNGFQIRSLLSIGARLMASRDASRLD